MESKKEDYDWDDELLIKMYDDGMKSLMEHIGEKDNKKEDTNRKKGSKHSKNIAWEVGDHCQAIYSEDSLPYEAVIKKVDDVEMTCVVEYLGYGNEEVVAFKDLAPSKGRSAQRRQEESASANWKIGDYCWAVYSEDNNSYEAKIIGQVDDYTYTVKFLGYNNVEDVAVSDLEPSQRSNQSRAHSYVNSIGICSDASSVCSEYSSMSECSSSRISRENRSCSHSEVDESVMYRSSSRRHRHQVIRPINSSARGLPLTMPPPGNLGDDDALSSLLLSWYMAGYHTGYHMAAKSMRT